MIERIKNRKNIIKKFKECGPLLEPGFFYFYKNHFRKSTLNDISHLFRIVYIKRHKSYLNLTHGTFYYGAHKRTVVQNNFAYIYYLEKKDLKRILRIKNNYLELIPYKTAKILKIKDDVVIMENVVGKEIEGIDDQSKFLQYLIDKQLDSSSILYKDNQYYSIQHGDCTSRNARLVKNDYVFFDLDDINYYPVLYDYFYCLISYNKYLKKNLNQYLSEFIVGINNLAIKLNIIADNSIDYFLSNFLSYLKRFGLKNYERLAYWKNDFNFENFPEVKKIFDCDTIIAASDGEKQ